MGFLQDFDTETKACYQNEPPFCTAVCPFALDVRDFMAKMKKGRWNAAFRNYQTAVGFPGIVSQTCPAYCEKECIRRRLDDPLRLKLLEQAALHFAGHQDPNAYNMPQKKQQVAVIGGGLSGLAVALRLCNRKYQVTVYEKTASLGGSLRTEMDPEMLGEDIRMQFQYETCSWHLSEEITDLAAVRADAYYIATGKGGADFGLQSDAGGAFASDRPGYFLGGQLTGRDAVQAIADGLNAANAVERYLKTSLMNEPELPSGTRIEMDLSKTPAEAAVVPADPQAYSKEEAQAEAGRCLSCSCDACIRECDLMRIYKKYPRRIYEEVYITIHPGTLSHDGRWATRLISTCNQCGLCRDVCPQRIDAGSFFRKAHQALVDDKVMPWAFHDFWLRDMDFADGEQAALCRLPAGVTKAAYAFFPGCQMGASDPEYVLKSYEWLLPRLPDTGLLLGCCGAPAVWAGQKAVWEERHAAIRAAWEQMGRPVMLFACPTCRNMFAEYLPEIPGAFLYEKMAQLGVDRPQEAPDVRRMSVFDACAARNEPGVQEAVRQLAEERGIELVPLEHEKDRARCCSYGGQVRLADPGYAAEMTDDRIRENDLPYITYCVNCRDTFAAAGKPACHILDLVFGISSENRRQPDLSARRDNRVRLKRELLARFWQEVPDMKEEKEKLPIIFTEEIRQKMDQEMVLEEEVRAVVEHCEQTGEKVLSPDTGRFAGHLRLGHMTFWVVYEMTEGSARIWNVYAHRMNLEAEDEKE